MEDHQDDFLKHIKGVLREHEEDYRQGAWEQFSRQHLQAAPAKIVRVIPLWRRVAVAAAVLAGIFLAAHYFMTSNSDLPPDLVKDTPAQTQNGPAAADPAKPGQPNSPLTPGTSSDEHLNAFPAEQHVAASSPYNGNRQIAQNNTIEEAPVFPADTPAGVKEPASNGLAPAKAAPADRQPEPLPPGRVAPGREKMQPSRDRSYNPAPYFAHESSASREESRSKKWTPSVYISPMFGESDVNMGYGVALGYAVNDKIKISAGIAHNKMTASRNFDVSFSPPNAALNSGAKGALAAASPARSLMNNDAAVPQQQLERVNASLSGFDIPVDISYNFTNRLYATAGVSGMVVVKDNALYYYKDAENQQISVENNQGILKEDKNIQVIKSSVSNAAPEASEKERTPFLGFYNVSFGYKQKVTHKNNVAIEPFLKVPMKNVSDQKLNYTGMGIRLKFDF
ncbi:hypothetical protein [Niabella drilacis]|uniref:Outer membrane protein beta-barrel domain-containing protein n=1 Tax=Niabella drilacis (strain DSM 25811 / CCM 8410 / CCUG 62505 / LMG 26954 / E90) TaxID=1285928 RepID=A0A1G6U2S4_NIADE|nr:hypothetical protein [Niabella drilacis]SDD35649.1 hypothetical protein SAMN04487894_108126 [Niabella drilacis]